MTLLSGRWAVEKSVYHCAGMEQVRQRAERGPIQSPYFGNGACGGSQIGPGGGNERTALVREDEQ
jgi:hypothetical protein